MKQKNIETPDFSLKEEISKIRSLPKEKRWEYIWDYYKATLFFVLFSVFFIWMLGSFLVNMIAGTLFPKEPISIAFAAPGFSNCESWMEQCLEAIGYDEDTEKLQAMSTSPHSDIRDDFVINTTVWFTAGQPDIFVIDEASYQHLLELGVLADITQRWPEDLQQLAAGYMVSNYALEISDTSFAQAYGLSEEPTYLCMFVRGLGFDRALDIVEYILLEG